MSTEGDRRAEGASRVPFEALVEVGGALGPSFEAHAIDVSEQGMHLRTVYLPEVGQPLTCRFETGPGQTVLASGEVTWTDPGKAEGEFGIKFTDLDEDSIQAIRAAMSPDEEPLPLQPKGAKVRLHIEGLGAPMKAKVKQSEAGAVTVGSELGFLQVGKNLDLEDTANGQKRPAQIDRVGVEVDPNSRIPQLVVTLKYQDVQAKHGATADSAHEPKKSSSKIAAGVAAGAAASVAARDGESDEAMAMRGGLARAMAGVGPRMEAFARQARTTIGLLASRARGSATENQPTRRTTAPPPGGVYQSNGRKSRATTPDVSELSSAQPDKKTLRRGLALGSAALAAVALIALAARKPASKEMASAHVEPPPPAVALATSAEPAVPPAPVLAAAPPVAPAPPPVVTPPPAAPEPVVADAKEAKDSKETKAHKHHHAVASFSNGPVHHGNILRLHMDGPVEAIHGASTPTGFTVKIPSRKATEPAGPLAARDARIGSIRVTNETDGAEFSLTFKDGVPNYRVSAKGDAIEIALAPTDQPVADHDHPVASRTTHGTRQKTSKRRVATSDGDQPATKKSVKGDTQPDQ